MRLTIKDVETENSFYKELKTNIIEILKNNREDIYRAKVGLGFRSLDSVYSDIATEIIKSLK